MHRWAVTALWALLVGCGEGSVTLDVFVARSEEDLFAGPTCYTVRADWEGGSRTTSARDLEDLGLVDLEPATYDFVLEAVRPNEGGGGDCTGPVIGRAKAFDARVERGEDLSVSLVLVPMNRLSRLPVPDWVERWFGERGELAAVSVGDRAGVPRVVFSGGRLQDGTISRDLLVYEPRRFEFTLLGEQMSCARAGHAAAAVGTAGEDQTILLVGGDGECDDGAPSQATAEILDPREGTVARTGDPMPVPRPRTAVAPGGDVFVMGSGPDADALIQRFDGSTFPETPSLVDPRIPASGGSITSAFADGRGPWIVAGGRRRDGTLLGGISLFDASQNDLAPCPIEGDPLELSGDSIELAPTRYGEVLLTGTVEEGGLRWWRVWPDPACDSVSRVVRGELSISRLGHVSTSLPDGQVLLTGSDGGGSAELFMPEVGTTMAIEPAVPRYRNGHVAVALEDGSVLLAGGGPPEVELFLPRDVSSSDRFGWDRNAEPKPTLDVLVVVSNSQEAEPIRQILQLGGYLDSAGERVQAGPTGLLAAIEPLNPLVDPEFVDPDIRIEVTTGDMRCDGGGEGDGGEGAVCADPMSPDEQAACVRDSIAAGGGCPAQELFRAAIAAAEGLRPESGERDDVPLLVLIAAPRDDCSADVGSDFFEPSDLSLTTRCATQGSELYDPKLVLDALGAIAGGDSERISVLTIGGPDTDNIQADGKEAPAACAQIRPTPRLAALARAHRTRGHHVDLCQASPNYPPLQWWSDLVDSRIGRRICLDHAPRDPLEPSCAVTYDRDLGGGLHEAVRLGYRYLPTSDSECATGVLELTDPGEIPIGEEVTYACQ